MRLLDLIVTTSHWFPEDSSQRDEIRIRTKGILRQREDHDSLSYSLEIGEKGNQGQFKCEWILPYSRKDVIMNQTGDSEVQTSFKKGELSESLFRMKDGSIIFQTETLDLIKTQNSLCVRYDLVAPNGERTCHEIRWQIV